jgi:hypothetical protein
MPRPPWAILAGAARESLTTSVGSEMRELGIHSFDDIACAIVRSRFRSDRPEDAEIFFQGYPIPNRSLIQVQYSL